MSAARTDDNAAAVDRLFKESRKISEAVDVLKENIIEKLKGTGDYDGIEDIDDETFNTFLRGYIHKNMPLIFTKNIQVYS